MPFERLALTATDGPIDRAALTAHFAESPFAYVHDGRWYVAADRASAESMQAVCRHRGTHPSSGVRLVFADGALHLTHLGDDDALRRCRSVIEWLRARLDLQVSVEGGPEQPLTVERLDALFGPVSTAELHPTRPPIESGRLLVWSRMMEGDRHALAVHDGGAVEYEAPDGGGMIGRLDTAPLARWRDAIDELDFDAADLPERPAPARTVFVELHTPDDEESDWFEVDAPPKAFAALTALAAPFLSASVDGERPPGVGEWAPTPRSR